MALSEHRYTWRRNQVLKEVSKLVVDLVNSAPQVPLVREVKFVKEGEQPKGSSTRTYQRNTGILSTAVDCVVQTDIGSQLSIPKEIVDTSLRPDMIVISEASKTIVLIELTVPWEDRMEEAHELK